MTSVEPVRAIDPAARFKGAANLALTFEHETDGEVCVSFGAVDIYVRTEDLNRAVENLERQRTAPKPAEVESNVWAARDQEVIDKGYRAWRELDPKFVSPRPAFEAGARYLAGLHSRRPRKQKDSIVNYKDLGTVLTLMVDANANFIEIQWDLLKHFDLPEWARELVTKLNDAQLTQLQRSQTVRELYDRLWWLTDRLDWKEPANSLQGLPGCNEPG